eukprot:TRINITY_DN35531_c0_g1_i1.p1 TRINITY_DN35531_c0_g1~~TRINITY_DN35531_c0_g1_i1.p1  ORF type:complete len:543 (-),score=82.54 TRINITY_DN35531_c0_g1_i1:162-1790(-)
MWVESGPTPAEATTVKSAKKPQPPAAPASAVAKRIFSGGVGPEEESGEKGKGKRAKGDKASGKSKGKGKDKGGKGQGKGRKGDFKGSYGPGSRGKGQKGEPGIFDAASFEGEWLDSFGQKLTVEPAEQGRGSMSVKVSTLTGRIQLLSLRWDSATWLWVCGNGVLDAASSSSSCRVWEAGDGRRTVWDRPAAAGDQAAGDNAETPPDLFPWLLVPESALVSIGEEADDEDSGEREAAAAAGAEGARHKDYDGGRVSALLDMRQVLGRDHALQETLSGILMDYDLCRQSGDDPMVPPHGCALWERLAEAPRRNALYAASRFHAQSSPSCPVEIAAHNFSLVRVGRHQVPVAATDVHALLNRWTGRSDFAIPRSSAMAHVIALYRTLESPLVTNQRSVFQLSSMPQTRREMGVEYEIFASPFNAIVENGKYGSRWPHAEVAFGSAGSYPAVIDQFPEAAVVGVNPPSSPDYLDHVMNKSLEKIVARFREVHLVCPVRDASWRPQLRRLQGVEFVSQCWDATAQQAASAGEPVLSWLGSSLAAPA